VDVVVDAAPSLFSRVGSSDEDRVAFFERLVDAFYEGVATDDVLLPLYPEQPDLTGARHRLTLFLAQYWGGPQTYMEERGHPKLRMRHFPFHVGPLERDRWLLHMAAAVERTCADQPTGEAIADEMMAYFVPAAEHLRNDTGLPITSASYPRA
jgi:hemoglobin